MERGIYFDGWYPNEHCYHPSMPPRRLSMIDDLEDMGGTILVWAGLGGGSISLSYLEEEAFGQVPARFRQHGYVNDSEFIHHAKDRGIDLFAIVFEAQAWEFPAEVVDGEVLAQNQLRGAGPASTVGLRDFSADTGPASWKPFRHYFPDGLVNSDGEQVSDLWEEVVSRDLDGEPLRAHWVEVDGKGQVCYLADRNNPVWREYLKAIVRIQIDAGAPGIQLDETDVPLLALRYGGCFCKDCMKGFRRYLLGLDDTPAELAEVDLATFDYRTWLRDQGFQKGVAPQTFPLYEHYTRFQEFSIAETFREITAYVREYAASKNHPIRIAGNFYDCAPYYDAMVDDVDVLVTEMRETKYQQPWYFRHGVGLSRGKPLVAVENPYGGVTDELLTKLQEGRARDLFRLTIFEASAMGANMSLPYGSWLGTEVKDSYWVPRKLAVEVGRFLKSIDAVTSNVSEHSTAVIYSVASVMRSTIDSDQFFDQNRWYERVEARDARPASYWETIELLSRSTRTFDTVVFPDEALRATDVGASDLGRYSTVVLPDVWNVSAGQHELLVDFVDRGGNIIVNGEYGTELESDDAARLLEHPNTSVAKTLEQVATLTSADVIGDLGELAAASIHSLADGTSALHLVNYDYDDVTDSIRERFAVAVGVRVTHPVSTAVLHAPGGEPAVIPVDVVDGVASVVLPRIGTYAIVHLS
ncbi:alpha-amylase family protein [Leifsonia sp. Root227]|uniref:alpha-amylase family protein n=1 Tax=Leifsonia sp. Root227 TaxID=1736496 RepID=UPI000AE5E132|nr:alpha-amylase family protein [Leifsonia sp. Root227]